MTEPLPAKYNFSLYRGDTRVWEHQFKTDADAAIDITGWIFESTYRLTPDGTDAVAVEDCEVTDGPGGVLTRTLIAEQSALLPAGRVAWDLQATEPGGAVRTFLYNDNVKVTGDVTR